MTRPSIPALALGIALALAACAPPAGQTGAATEAPSAAVGSTAPTPSQTTTPGASADATAAIVVRDFELDPATVSISGETLGFDVTNEGPTVHNVTVRDAAGSVVLASRDLREGESETVVGAIPPGTYVLFCSLPGHESLGIKGTLTVTAP